MIQVNTQEWDEQAAPIYLAILPILPDDFQIKYGVKFTDDVDDLDKLRFAVVRIDDCLFWLESRPNGPERTRFISASVRSTEPDLTSALVKLLAACGLSNQDLLHHQTQVVGPPRWILQRIDDNGNKVEMYRFHFKESASIVSSKFEKRGHKQTYIIEETSS